MDAVLIECKKTNLEYKKHAITCLGSILASLDTASVITSSEFNEFERVKDVLISCLEDLARETVEGKTEPASSTASSEESSQTLSKGKSSQLLALKMATIRAISTAWPRAVATQRYDVIVHFCYCKE